jgi:hypothetical protein
MKPPSRSPLSYREFQTMSVPADIRVIADGECRRPGRTARQGEGRVLGGCDTMRRIEELLTRSRP